MGFLKKINIFKKDLSYKDQKRLWAFIFLLPWVFGLVLLFLYPLIESLLYSFSNVQQTDSGLVSNWNGFSNYLVIFNKHVNNDTFFKVELISTLGETLINLPVIAIFSLIMATILNTEFRGRGIARAIFFIPVILNSAAVLQAMSGLSLPGESVTEGMKIFDLEFYLANAGLSEGIINMIVGLVSRMTSIITLSGIPILLFLTSIQSIPSHLYEAAKIEGATSYETFWLITFPNVTPHILTVLIYVLVDSFLTSPITQYIQSTIDGRETNFVGLSSAMSWMYTIVVLVLVAVIVSITKALKWGESHYAN